MIEKKASEGHSWTKAGSVFLRDDERIDDLERNGYGIIQRKREQKAMKSAGQPQEEAKAKLKEWRARQTDLVEQTGLKRQYDRERAGG